VLLFVAAHDEVEKVTDGQNAAPTMSEKVRSRSSLSAPRRMVASGSDRAITAILNANAVARAAELMKGHHGNAAPGIAVRAPSPAPASGATHWEVSILRPTHCLPSIRSPGPRQREER
jgi:hypothetical protein